MHSHMHLQLLFTIILSARVGPNERLVYVVLTKGMKGKEAITAVQLHSLRSNTGYDA